jgi:stage II sporulation protein D
VVVSLIAVVSLVARVSFADAVGLTSGPGASSCPAPGGVPVPAASASGSGILVQGRGWGHGLGMSQYGAQGAARLGCSHQQILGAYYAGTHLANTAMNAPVQLTLLTARRSTVYPETSAITWAGAGRTLSQPARTTWTVTTAGAVTTLTSPTGAVLLRVGAGGTLEARHAGAVVRLRSFTSTASTAAPAVDLRLRWGTLGFAATSTAATVSETIASDASASAVDKYLWGLGEVPVSWPQEALRAQADAARTYLTHTWDPSRHRYVIGVTTAAQVYRGAAQEDTDLRYHSPWRAAVAATHDEVVVDARGNPIWAMYASSDGGRAESRAYVYGNQAGYGYLVGLDDSRWDLASDNPRRSWAVVFSPADLARRLGFSSVTAVTIAAPGTPGRGTGVAVTGVRSGRAVTARFTGDQIRGALGLLSPVITVTWPAPVTTPQPAPTPTPTPTSTPVVQPPAVSGAPVSRAPAAGSSGLSGPVTSTACGPGACGSATARFSGAFTLVGLSETVQDTSCNGRRAYVRVRVRYTDGTSQLTSLRSAAARCRPPATTYRGLSWRASKPIAGFAVVVGQSGQAALVGRYLDNPNT